MRGIDNDPQRFNNKNGGKLTTEFKNVL